MDEIKVALEKTNFFPADDNKLKIFLFNTRPIQYPPVPNEKNWAVVAWKLDDAMSFVHEEVAKNAPVSMNVIYSGNFVEAEKMIEQIRGFAPAEPVKVAELNLPAMSRDQFIWNLQLVCDSFVQDDEDKNKIKEILKKLNK